MAYVPMNRTRALIICTHPQDYLPARLREAARYLLDRRDTTEEERRLATEAIEGLRSKRAEPRAGQRKRKEGVIAEPGAFVGDAGFSSTAVYLASSTYACGNTV